MRKHAHTETAALLRRFADEVSRTAQAGTPDSIHDLRVSIRRLSRCLRVFSQFFPARSWKKARGRLARLIQYAGTVRDRDIALELLRQSGVSPRSAVARQLTSERSKAWFELLAELRRWEARGFSQKWRSRLELEA